MSRIPVEELHPKLKQFVRPYTIHVGATLTQQKGGFESRPPAGEEPLPYPLSLVPEIAYGRRLPVATYIDIGDGWSADADDDYVDRLAQLLLRFKSRLVYDTGGPGWTIETDPDRGVVVETLYRGWLFDHQFCEHSSGPESDRACELNKQAELEELEAKREEYALEGRQSPTDLWSKLMYGEHDSPLVELAKRYKAEFPTQHYRVIQTKPDHRITWSEDG